MIVMPKERSLFRILKPFDQEVSLIPYGDPYYRVKKDHVLIIYLKYDLDDEYHGLNLSIWNELSYNDLKVLIPYIQKVVYTDHPVPAKPPDDIDQGLFKTVFGRYNYRMIATERSITDINVILLVTILSGLRDMI